jgi:predicted enzyme related to lactoylglutathione lyase
MTNPSQITPMVSVDDVERAVAFYKRLVFRSIFQLGTGSLIHVMPARALPEEGEHGVMIEHGPRGLGVILYVDVNDLDTFYNAAKKTGVHLMYAPRDEPWGDRTFRFVDPFGYDWCFAQRIDKTNKPGAMPSP